MILKVSCDEVCGKFGKMSTGKARLRSRLIYYNVFIVVAVSILFNVSSGQEITNCCTKASGSCKTVCEKMSLAEIAADNSVREQHLLTVNKFCSPELIEFWRCMNQTILEVVQGSEWWGRVCCTDAIAGSCQRVCATADSSTPLLSACRRSDELHFFSCLDRQSYGQECCGNTMSLTCHEACKDIFRTKLTPTREQKSKVTDSCEINSPRVMQCIRNYTKVTPVANPHKYLHCCENSSNNLCREACKKSLKSRTSTQEILDALQEGGCGRPLPHDPLYQCFLRTDSQSTRDNEISNINRLGIDSAKLHCCQKATTSHCKKLCLNTFTNDWAGRWEKFDAECLKQTKESALIHCIDEVEEPCELGCDGLSYCTNFNNRPTELFRACNPHADVAAHYDVALWQQQGFLNLPGLQLPIKNISKCSHHVWKAVACTLQIKPCSRLEHANRICKEDCYSILTHCMDWTKIDGDHNAASLCAKLSPDDPETPCISLQNFMEPSDNPYMEPYEQVSSPCKGDPCNVTQVCSINRNCPYGRSCNAYTCINGCPLGEASQFLVPEGTYVRIPISNSQKGCLKICKCSGKGVINECQPLPCISYDNCKLSNKDITHGSIFYMECNLCTCFAGEIVCNKKQCDYLNLGDPGSDALIPYARLPCHCPPHHVPVCGSDGNTYPSACLAKCLDLRDADIEFGSCSSKQVCAEVSCPKNSECLPNPNVCLSLMHRPCPQHMCVNTTHCSLQPIDPVCDTDGKTHQNACFMLLANKRLDYVGKCLTKCSKFGEVCGINGNTYRSECAAWADFVSVDYEGSCLAVGMITDAMSEKCKFEHVTCPPLTKSNCFGFTPPGACCPVCGGAMKLLYSRKQIDRALYALRGHSLTALTLKSVLKSLQRHIQVAECVIRGYLTIELEIFVMVQSTEKRASDLQLEACVRESEKLSSMIRRHSARIVSELSLSALIVATDVHTVPSDGAFIIITPILFWSCLMTCLLNRRIS